jgi:hypothetical protein
MPSFDGGDNFVWIGDPFEGFGMGVVIDRGLEVGDGSEDSAFEAAFGEGCEETLNGVGQEAEAGVKWKVHRGLRANHWRTTGCL